MGMIVGTTLLVSIAVEKENMSLVISAMAKLKINRGRPNNRSDA